MSVEIVDCRGATIKPGMKVIVSALGERLNEYTVKKVGYHKGLPSVLLDNDLTEWAHCVMVAADEVFLIELIRRYTEHMSNKCRMPEKFPWKEDCPCGLLGALKRAGLPEEWASNALRD